MEVFVFVYRERQDTDGQLKELQDQLEAEQYFSVSLYSAIMTRCIMVVHFT